MQMQNLAMPVDGEVSIPRASTPMKQARVAVMGCGGTWAGGL
jgi:hypothetical protein